MQNLQCEVLRGFIVGFEMITEFTVNHGIFKTSTVCSQCNSICTLNKDTLLFRYHKQCIKNKKAKKQCTYTQKISQSRLVLWKGATSAGHLL